MAESAGERLRRLVTERAGGLCEYCRSPEAFAPERFSLEHIQPRASGGLTVEENLALACQGCNGHKAAKTTATDAETQTPAALFHPRRHLWQEHFAWSEDRLQIIGLTPTGRATVLRLHLNRASLLNLCRALLAINAHPPAANP